MTLAKDGTISAEQFSKIIGVTTRRAQQLVGEGVINASKDKGKYQFPFPQCVQEYIAYWEDKALGRNSSNAETSDLEKKKLIADVSYREAKAKKAVMELEELEGVLHSSDIVEDCMNELIFYIRSNLLALPGKVGIDVTDELDKYFGEIKPSAAVVTDIMLRDITKILEDFSMFRYDKDKMKRLTKEKHTGILQDTEDADEEE